jgi:hypothetical protein
MCVPAWFALSVAAALALGCGSGAAAAGSAGDPLSGGGMSGTGGVSGGHGGAGGIRTPGDSGTPEALPLDAGASHGTAGADDANAAGDTMAPDARPPPLTAVGPNCPAGQDYGEPLPASPVLTLVKGGYAVTEGPVWLIRAGPTTSDRPSYKSWARAPSTSSRARCP